MDGCSTQGNRSLSLSYVVLKRKRTSWWSSGFKIPSFQCRGQGVQSVTAELRSHMLWRQKKKKKWREGRGRLSRHILYLPGWILLQEAYVTFVICFPETSIQGKKIKNKMPGIVNTIFKNQSERIKMQEEPRCFLKSKITCENLKHQFL